MLFSYQMSHGTSWDAPISRQLFCQKVTEEADRRSLRAWWAWQLHDFVHQTLSNQDQLQWDKRPFQGPTDRWHDTKKLWASTASRYCSFYRWIFDSPRVEYSSKMPSLKTEVKAGWPNDGTNIEARDSQHVKSYKCNACIKRRQKTSTNLRQNWAWIPMYRFWMTQRILTET